MAPQNHSVVNATQAWLQCTWHVQVPFAWLEACVDWLQEEAGGAARLSQQQINQQVGSMSVLLTKMLTSISEVFLAFSRFKKLWVFNSYYCVT